MADTASERLARALEAKRDPRLTSLIRQARAGHYDDFRSKLAFPIMRLVRDLQALGFHDLAEQAKGGVFDASKEEAETWFRSPEGQAAIKELVSG